MIAKYAAACQHGLREQNKSGSCGER